MTVQKISDVTVTIDVQKPNPGVGLTNGMLLVKGNEEKYQEYQGIDEVALDYEEGGTVYKAAETYFLQTNAPDILAILTYQSAEVDDPDAQLASPSSLDVSSGSNGATVTSEQKSNTKIPGIVKAVKDYFWGNWEFLFMADFDKDDATSLSKFIDQEDFHIFLPFVASDDDASAFSSFNRTWPVIDKDVENRVDAAIIGAGGPQDPGSLNWKFLHNLKNLDVNYTNPSEVAKEIRNGVICYTVKNQTPALSGDRNAQGFYIDFYHGKDFVKNLVENNMQSLLFSNNKIPYGQTGIDLTINNLKGSLKTAYDMGIIADDADGKAGYSVDEKAFKDVKGTDILKRILKGLKFGYIGSNGIDNVEISGTANQY